jgi:hypothetical protein
MWLVGVVKEMCTEFWLGSLLENAKLEDRRGDGDNITIGWLTEPTQNCV